MSLKNNLPKAILNMDPQLFWDILPCYLKFNIESPMECALARVITCQIKSDISQLCQIIMRLSDIKISFKFQKIYVTYHKLLVTCPISRAWCHLKCITGQMSHITCHLSPVTNANSDSHKHSPCPTMHSSWIQNPQTHNESLQALTSSI